MRPMDSCAMMPMMSITLSSSMMLKPARARRETRGQAGGEYWVTGDTDSGRRMASSSHRRRDLPRGNYRPRISNVYRRAQREFAKKISEFADGAISRKRLEKI